MGSELLLMMMGRWSRDNIRNIFIQVRKNDFIYHIKGSNMFNLFETTDPDSDRHWQNHAITALKYCSILILFILLFYLDCLIRTLMAILTRKSLNG